MDRRPSTRLADRAAKHLSNRHARVDVSLPADIREKGFESSAREGAAGDGILVHMQGEADLRAKPHLGGFFRAIHATALQQRANVHVDLRAVTFMNSSCLQEFVGWLSALSKTPADTDYKIVFLSDPSQYWQGRSLQALVAFAPGRVLVES